MRPGRAFARFNDGCSHYSNAASALSHGNISEYERNLTSAGGDITGALEWGIKVYLRSNCRHKLSPEDFQSLHKPNFQTLVDLLNAYAKPSLSDTQLSAFQNYRDSMRNPGEHDASIPSLDIVNNAIRDVREFLIKYVGADSSQLSDIILIPDGDSLQDLRTDYLRSIVSRYEYLDLGGISPRVGNKVIRIKMGDVFVPLTGVESTTLLEQFGEGIAAGGDPEWPNPGTWAFSSAWEGAEPTSASGTDGAESRVSSRQSTLVKLLDEPRLVILGDPGSGKTTFGKHIALCLATLSGQELGHSLQGRLPIMVRASDFGEQSKVDPALNFYTFVTDQPNSKYGRLFASAIRTGSALVIIDGLDEVADPTQRSTCARRIEDFVSEYPVNHFVISSRIIGYRQNPLVGDFKEVRIAPFSPGQILQFLKNWYRAVENESVNMSDAQAVRSASDRQAEELRAAILENPGTRRLATNPLLLTIIALASWRGTKLPNRRVELYQIATETLLENWPLRQRGQHLHADDLLSILEPVAFEMFHMGSSNAITESVLKPIVEAAVCEVQGVSPKEAQAIGRDILERIEDHTGFFVERGFDPQGQSVYGFLHQTFAEYLAGRHLVNQLTTTSEGIRNLIHDPRWREVILLMAGHLGAWSKPLASRVVEDILKFGSPYEVFVNRDLYFAAAILADDVRVNRNTQDEVVAQLIDQFLKAPNTAAGRASEYLLTSISSVAHIGNLLEKLEPLLSDPPDVGVRKASLCLSIGHAEESSIRVLLGHILSNANEEAVRFPAVIGLEGGRSSGRPVAMGLFRVYEMNVFLPLWPKAIECLAAELKLDSLFEKPHASTLGQVEFVYLDDIKSVGVDGLIKKILPSNERIAVLLLSASYYCDMQIETLRALVSIGLSSEWSTTDRTRALRAIVEFMEEEEFDVTTLSDSAEHLKSLIVLDVEAGLREVALDLIDIVCFDESESEDALKLYGKLLDSWPPSKQSQLIQIVKRRWDATSDDLPDIGSDGSSVSDKIATWLRTMLDHDDLDVRMNSCYSIVRMGVGNSHEAQTILDVLERGTPESVDLFQYVRTLIKMIDRLESSEISERSLLILEKFFKSLSELASGDLDRAHDFAVHGFRSQLFNGEKENERSLQVIGDLLDSSIIEVQKIGVHLQSSLLELSDSFGTLFERYSNDSEMLDVIWHNMPPKAFESEEVLELALAELEASGIAQVSPAAYALMRIQDKDLQLSVSRRAEALLGQNPTNAGAISVLWGYYGLTDWHRGMLAPF